MAILEAVGGYLPKTDFQKLIFLFSQMQEKPAYDFFPYKFGCYSLQLDLDLKTLEKYEYIQERENGWRLTRKMHFFESLSQVDRNILKEQVSIYEKLKGKKLIKYVYNRFPYYAIHTEIAESILSKKEWKKVQEIEPLTNKASLFTIGYEGKTIDAYINQLIQNNIQTLCDIRKNPISMKYGFSKNLLKRITESAGIQYIHFPEMGIESVKRRTLHTEQDYKSLFHEYVTDVLSQNQKDQVFILNLLKEKKRIALTCFEADPNFCHRLYAAQAIIKSCNHSVPL
ncbi:MAG: DUF488 family protein, partial [Leptospiraceae bacterium]|nr:DUF488 family protein [Leptospiraceae bacterium]